MLTLWATGLFGLWFNGIKYVALNTTEFTDVNGHTIHGEYTITINLNVNISVCECTLTV